MIKENKENQFLNSEQQDKNPTFEERENNDIHVTITRAFESVSRLETSDSGERLQKMLLSESLTDVDTTLREGGTEDTLNLLVAYRGLEQIKSQYNLEQEDFGIQQTMDALRNKIKGVERFDIGEVKDLDEIFEQSHKEVKKVLKENTENISAEQAVEQKNKFDRYFSLKQEIQARQRQILGDSKSFYRGISEKISGPLLSFLEEQGEKIDNSMRDSRTSLLRYLGKYNIGSKLARGIGLSIITASALGYVFKGELAEAAQHEKQTTESRYVSPEELKTKNPEIYLLLQEQGFIQKAGMEFQEETTPSVEERTEQKGEYKNLPVIFQKALQSTEAASLLESPEYKNADTIPELQELYKKFNEKDADPSDDLALMVKYHEFLRNHSEKELIAEYGKKETSEFFRQAGFLTSNSLKKYYEKDMGDNGVDSKLLPSYLEGFKNAADFYKQSLKLGEKFTKEKGMHRAFSGIMDINDTLSDIANTIMIYGNKGDKITAASMRQEVYQNLKEFESIKDQALLIDLRDEKFLIPDARTLAKVLKSYIPSQIYNNWMESGKEAGVGFPTTDFAEKTNKILRTNEASKTDKQLIELLVSQKILIKTEAGVEANPEKPVLLFTTIASYNHENQHHESKKNSELIEYWSSEWNKTPEPDKKEFVRHLWDTGYFRFLNRQEAVNLAKENFSPKEMIRINTDILQGKNIPDKDILKSSIIQEFLAYSTDNSSNLYFNPKHELPFKDFNQ